MRIWRALDRVLALAPFGLSVTALLLLLTQSPFAAPYVAREVEAVRAELAAALAREVTPEWYHTEIEAALAAGDLDRMRLVAMTGARHALTPDEDLLGRMQDLEAEQTGALAAVRDCAVCAADITACPRVALLAMCGITVEMTPVGDLNALRRAGMAALDDAEEVDRIDLALAVVGLGATGLVLVTGGSSVTVKAGATVLRLGRRLGKVSAGFAADLRRLSEIGLKPGRIGDYALGRAPLETVVDTGKLAGIGALAGDLGHVVSNSSLTDTVLLLGALDGAGDARRLARLSDVAGPETRATVELLGKGRAFRALVRIADLALGAAALLWLVASQLLLLIGERIGRLLLGAARAPVRRRAEAPGTGRRVEPPLTRPQPKLRPDPPLRRPVASASVLGHTPAR